VSELEFNVPFQQQRCVTAVGVVEVGVVEVGVHSGWCGTEGVVDGLPLHGKLLRHRLRASTGRSINHNNDNNDTSCSLKHHITATSDSKQCRQLQLFTIMTTAFYPMTAFPPISRTLSPIIRCSCPAHQNAHTSYKHIHS